MKTLVLMRHAKSSWDAGDVTDHDRVLSPRGRASAPRIGRWLAEQRVKPQKILCSTAARVNETLALLLPALPKGVRVEATDKLYMALPREIITEIAETGNDVGTLLVIGHNPGIGSLAIWLAGQGEKKSLERLASRFPTAAVAIIDLDIASWRELDSDIGTLRVFVTPKDLGDA
jgi:phosphohistidine phosphatase